MEVGGNARIQQRGKIRIPINESADDKSQIEEYLKEYRGEGIQHIAVGTEDIYAGTEAIAGRGLEFMPPPPDVYYDLSIDRVKGHGEPLDGLRRHGILIDGEGVVDGGATRVLLQIFSKTVVGPIFFEFIQRKGDDGFGEGNFKALFESIEADQIARGCWSRPERRQVLVVRIYRFERLDSFVMDQLIETLECSTIHSSTSLFGLKCLS